MTDRLRALLAALLLAVGAGTGLGGCGDAEVDDAPGNDGAEVDGEDSYDPDDLDEREENQ